ncbi:hypothetical protein, partial [Bacillus pumilus]|uniref:hypothetical protein n=1 Tax=Bacillus pumilus TaxID=1408 RepID=UPI001C92D291
DKGKFLFLRSAGYRIGHRYQREATTGTESSGTMLTESPWAERLSRTTMTGGVCGFPTGKLSGRFEIGDV